MTPLAEVIILVCNWVSLHLAATTQADNFCATQADNLCAKLDRFQSRCGSQDGEMKDDGKRVRGVETSNRGGCERSVTKV